MNFHYLFLTQWCNSEIVKYRKNAPSQWKTKEINNKVKMTQVPSPFFKPRFTIPLSFFLCPLIILLMKSPSRFILFLCLKSSRTINLHTETDLESNTIGLLIFNVKRFFKRLTHSVSESPWRVLDSRVGYAFGIISKTKTFINELLFIQRSSLNFLNKRKLLFWTLIGYLLR